MGKKQFTPEERQDLKDGFALGGAMFGLVARRTKTKVDDKIAKFLTAITSPQNEALLDQFIDIVDRTVPA